MQKLASTTAIADNEDDGHQRDRDHGRMDILDISAEHREHQLADCLIMITHTFMRRRVRSSIKFKPGDR